MSIIATKQLYKQNKKMTKTITRKGWTLKKIYTKGERFFGKVLVKHEGHSSSMRITKESWESKK